MFDYVDQLPNGIYKVLLRLFSGFWDVCISVYDTLSLPFGDVLQNILTDIGLSAKWAEFITKFLQTPANAWVFNATLGEIVVGGLLSSIIVFGMIKFFTDIVF